MIVISKQSLLEPLSRVRPFVSEATNVSMLRNFCFRDGMVFGFDGECGVGTKCDLGMEFCVSAARFYPVVDSLFEDISLTLDTYTLKIRSGTNTTSIQTEATGNYPPIIPDDLQPFTTATNLTERVEQLIFSAEDNEDNFSGVAFRGEYVYATDGKRLSRAKLNDTCADEITLPRTAAKHLVRMGQPTNTYFSSGRFVAFWGDTKTVLVSALLAKKFPYDAIDQQCFVRVDRKYDAVFPAELSKAIQRVRRITAGKAEGNSVILQNTSENLTVRTLVKEVGSAEESVAWSFREPFTVKVNAQYLLDAMKRTRNVNLTNVIAGNGNSLRFSENGYEHLMALMS